MRSADLAIAAILLALSALVALSTAGLPYWSDYAPGPAFASFWVAGVGALVAAILFVGAWRRTADEELPEWPARDGARNVAVAVIAMALLTALMPWLGFGTSSLLFMLFLLFVVQRRPMMPSILTAVGTVALVESVFGLWLDIDLPRGLVGF